MKTATRVLEDNNERYYGQHVMGQPVEGAKIESIAKGKYWCIIDDDGKYQEIKKNSLIWVRKAR